MKRAARATGPAAGRRGGRARPAHRRPTATRPARRRYPPAGAGRASRRRGRKASSGGSAPVPAPPTGGSRAQGRARPARRGRGTRRAQHPRSGARGRRRGAGLHDRLDRQRLEQRRVELAPRGLGAARGPARASARVSRRPSPRPGRSGRRCPASTGGPACRPGWRRRRRLRLRTGGRAARWRCPGASGLVMIQQVLAGQARQRRPDGEDEPGGEGQARARDHGREQGQQERGAGVEVAARLRRLADRSARARAVESQ